MRWAWGAILLAVLLAAVWGSVSLAQGRIYQVDECQNAYTARILATGQTQTAQADVSPFLALISWRSQVPGSAADVFKRMRWLMAGLFWLNIFLVVWASGERLRSMRGLVALAAAATLAPWWDYGFEIRHDNLLLTGILLFWFLMRVRPAGVPSYLAAGGLVMLLQFEAFKGFVYTVPLSLAFLLFPPPGHRAPRWKLALGWLAGVVLVLVLMRGLYGALGLWELCLKNMLGVAGTATKGTRFWPWPALERIPVQAPLLSAVGVAALVAVAADLWQRGKNAFSWEGNLPEAFLLAVAGLALFANPNPYAYNLVNLVPYAFLLAFRYGAELCKRYENSALGLKPLLVAIVVFVHFIPFALVTRRHWSLTNARQERLMALAEELTDPVRDPVYDGVGLVPTRPSIHYRWYLHTSNIQSFLDGSGPRMRDLLAARPAAVFIPNYRTDWLSDEDHAFIRERYVPLADDFWVLGRVLAKGGGLFEIFHPGRYRISALKDSNLSQTCAQASQNLAAGGPGRNETFCGTVDGMPLGAGPVELSAGLHHLACAADSPAAVVWMGPRKDRVEGLGQGEHLRLFVNWY